MKAAIIDEKGNLFIDDVPVPTIGPYDALCEIPYGSTCAGTEINLMAGLHPNPVTYPAVLGHESVGRVIEVGSKVKNYHVGDLVSRVGAPANLLPGMGIAWGGFAQFGIAKDHWQMRKDNIPINEWNKYRVNQIICPEICEREAPMIITWRETLSYDIRIGVKAGKKVLIVGSGANALAHCANSINLGAEVWSVGSTKRKGPFQSLNIKAFYDYHEEDICEIIKSDNIAMDFDIIIDGVGASDTINKLLPLLKPNGVLGVYGWNGRRKYGINPFNSTKSFIVYTDGYDEEESNAEVQSMILQGKLDASLWYDKENPIPLSNISLAYENLKKHEALKYLISMK